VSREDQVVSTPPDIAGGYDTVLYDPVPNPCLDPSLLVGTGMVYGALASREAPLRVLDLGCGTGRQLEDFARYTTGEVVGVDRSHRAVEIARERCAPFGPRVQVEQRDLLDLEPGEIGTFDVICCIGVYYIVPPAVRQHLLEVMRRCLAPGGLLVMTYFSGAAGLFKASIGRLLRAGGVEEPPAIAISNARQQLQSLVTAIPADGYFSERLAPLLNTIIESNDTLLFHELLNSELENVETGALAAGLSGDGIQFLDYLAPTACAEQTSAGARVLVADALDLAGGGYRYALFAQAGAAETLRMGRCAVQWKTLLRPLDNDAVASVFKEPITGATATAHRETTAAALRLLCVRPHHWAELLQSVEARCKKQGEPFQDALALDIRALWQRRFVRPRALPVTAASSA
jgi:SAM-dependent methyltransferase